MNEHAGFGWLLVILGLVIAGIGLLWLFMPSVPWLGRLPGDIRIETGEHSFLLSAGDVPSAEPALEPGPVDRAVVSGMKRRERTKRTSQWQHDQATQEKPKCSSIRTNSTCSSSCTGR